MVLDDTTVPGYIAGYVRFINYDWPMYLPDSDEFLISDEQPFVTMAGDYLFGGHDFVGHALQILDRSASRGSFYNMITSSYLPHVAIFSEGTPFNGSTHYTSTPMQVFGRIYPAGFYVYNDSFGDPAQYYDWPNWYITLVISNDTVYFRTSDGAIVALEHGNP